MIVLLVACVTVRSATVPVTADTDADAALEYAPDPACRTCCIILRDGEEPRLYEGRYPLLGVDEDDLRVSDGYMATCAPCSCDLSTLPSRSSDSRDR